MGDAWSCEEGRNGKSYEDVSFFPSLFGTDKDGCWINGMSSISKES